jgi:dipeptidyl aminopeptidase/acylaminoacyl peptidase
MTQSLLTAEDFASAHILDDPQIDDEGRVVFVVHDPAPVRDRQATSQLWLSSRDGQLVRLTSGYCRDLHPRLSPSGRQLAFASDRAASGTLQLYVVDLLESLSPAARPRCIAPIAGVVEDIRWSADARHIAILTADEGSETGNLGGAIMVGSPTSSDDDIIVRRPATAWRRVQSVDIASGRTTCLSRDGDNVWEIGWAGSGPIAALISSDPSESGWYDAHVALLNPATGNWRAVYKPRWQLQSPRVSPDGRWLGVLEAPQSDRGLLAGAVVLVDLLSGLTYRPVLPADVTTLAWTTAGNLFWAGVRGQQSSCGFIELDGHTGGTGWTTREAWSGLLTLGMSYKVSAACSPNGQHIAAVREGHGIPPELARLERAPREATWQPVTSFNSHLSNRPVPELREHRWNSADGLSIEGLLLMPDESHRAGGPSPLIVFPHGGPTNAATPVFAAGFHAGDAVLLAQAGFIVLLPNVRGSFGRGLDFAMANIGDLGGDDLRDLESGVDSLVDAGLVDPDRVGITGVSYGGFLAKWAVVHSRRFAASVAVSGISNWLSLHNTSGLGRFCEIFLGGDPYDVNGPYMGRSPVIKSRNCRSAVLILHGECDLACPVSQAQEFYQAIAATGNPAELVVYRGAGHGMTARHHMVDVCVRMVAWFERHMALKGP